MVIFGKYLGRDKFGAFCRFSFDWAGKSGKVVKVIGPTVWFGGGKAGVMGWKRKHVEHLQVPAVAMWFALFSSAARAGVIVIGQLALSGAPNATPGTDGIAFDGDPNPLVLENTSWALVRVDKTDAAVLSSQVSNPVASFDDNLVFDSSTGTYFTRGTMTTRGDTLVRIDPVTHDHTTVGNLGAPQINFGGLAIDPLSNLWLGIDASTEQLWKVDKNTGVATFQRNITFPGGLQLHSMTITADGRFLMAAKAFSFNDGGEGIYQINPATGAATFLTSTNPNPSRLQQLLGLAQDPISGRYYGVRLDWDFSAQPQTYSLVEVMNVPEPNVALLMLLPLAARRRRH